MVAVEDQHHRCIREGTDASDAHTINTTENTTEPPALKYEDEEPEITFILPAGGRCVLIDGAAVPLVAWVVTDAGEMYGVGVDGAWSRGS